MSSQFWRSAPQRNRKRKEKPSPFRSLHASPAPGWGGVFPHPVDGWEIIVAGELSDKQGELHDRLIELPRNSRGIIYFDSCGGSAFIGLSLATLIRLRGLRVTGVVVGECSSAALMPFAACEERYVTPHTTLLFHMMRWQSEEQVRLEEAAEWARHFQVMETDQDLLMSRLFQCDPALLARWNRPGRFVSGSELVSEGLAKMIDLFSGTVWQQVGRLRSELKNSSAGSSEK